MTKKKIGEATIWNMEEDRKATVEEICDLIRTNKLILDRWVYSQHRTGNVFPQITPSIPSLGYEIREFVDDNIETRTHSYADPQTGKLITVEYEKESTT